MNRCIAQVERGFDLLDGVRLDRAWHDVVLRLAARSHNSLAAAHFAIRAGFPVQAAMLARSVHEDFETASYVRRNHRAARFWSARKYGRGRNWRHIPKPSTVRNDLKPIDPAFAAKCWEIYDTTSQLSHPRPNGLLTEADRTPTTITYNVGPRAGLDAEMAYYFLIPITATALSLVRLFVGGRDPAWDEEAEALKRAVLDWLAAHAPRKRRLGRRRLVRSWARGRECTCRLGQLTGQRP